MTLPDVLVDDVRCLARRTGDGDGLNEAYRTVGLSGRRHSAATLGKICGGTPNVTDVRPVPSGPLGGTAGCGIDRATTGVRVDICAWSDQHTLGMVAFVGFPRTDDPPGVFGQIRAEVEQPAK